MSDAHNECPRCGTVMRDGTDGRKCDCLQRDTERAELLQRIEGLTDSVGYWRREAAEATKRAEYHADVSERAESERDSLRQQLVEAVNHWQELHGQACVERDEAIKRAEKAEWVASLWKSTEAERDREFAKIKDRAEAAEKQRDEAIKRAEQAEAEAEVLSGRACAEETANGAGPCGACKTCLRQRLEAAERERDSLQESFDEVNRRHAVYKQDREKLLMRAYQARDAAQQDLEHARCETEVARKKHETTLGKLQELRDAVRDAFGARDRSDAWVHLARLVDPDPQPDQPDPDGEHTYQSVGKARPLYRGEGEVHDRLDRIERALRALASPSVSGFRAAKIVRDALGGE